MQERIQITRHRKYTLTAHSPTLQVSCDLPIGLDTGDAQGFVRFFHIPVTGNLTWQDILRDFLIGLHTPPIDGARPWLSSLGNDFHARFGSLYTRLNALQAEDACSCVDAIGQAYLDAVREASTTLDVWNYPEIEGDGVCILAVTDWLWRLIQRFSYDFLQGSGQSEWHIFDGGTGRLGIYCGEEMQNAAIWPVFHHPQMPPGYVGLLYEYPDVHLKIFEERHESSWKDHVGQDGFWTASQTENWLVDKLIPKVIAHYGAPLEPSPISLRKRLAGVLVPEISTILKEAHQPRLPLYERVCTSDRVPLISVTEASQLTPYVSDLQQWFDGSPVSHLSTEYLRPYYLALIEIARHMEMEMNEREYYYLAGNVRVGLSDEDVGAYAPDATPAIGRQEQDSYAYVLHCLDLHAERISRKPFELCSQADFLSRAILWIIRHGQSTCAQEHIEAAKQAIVPLWEQCRFEARYRRPVA